MTATEEWASGLWRSEDMTKLEVLIQRDAAHDVMYYLGTTASAQLEDMTTHVPVHQRPFASELRRCEDIERRLKMFDEALSRTDIPVAEAAVLSCPTAEDLDTLEKNYEAFESELVDINGALRGLTVQQASCAERMQLLDHGSALGLLQYGGPDAAIEAPCALCGVIASAAADKLERMVYRLTRGHNFMRVISPSKFFDETGVPKSCFVIYFMSEGVKEKTQRVAESLGASVYNIHDSSPAQLMQTMTDLTTALQEAERRKADLLNRVAGVLRTAQNSVRAERLVLSAMNLVDLSVSHGRINMWVPTRRMGLIREAITMGERHANAEARSIIQPCTVQDNPPTAFTTNRFTSVFQGVVDSYGTARYKEVNPAVLTIITFPYLFGIMFGDMGHGVLLTLVGASLCLFESWFESSKRHELVDMVYGGRYLILLMGLFATYIGVLYNDFFGFNVGLFDSAYVWPPLPPYGPGGIVHPAVPNGRPTVAPPSPAVFGIDVAWAETENKLSFYNSIKMKCAVVVGVLHMTVGVLLSFANAIRGRRIATIVLRSIPELLFLTCTFGYMACLIVSKWLTRWPNTNEAPSLLNTMTNFFLAPGTVTGGTLYAGQEGLQIFLLLTAFGMTPVMLLGIPLWERRRGASHRDGEHHGETFGDAMIHSTIHTIEFVLGCVSNTASYLRLWALSLAHAQLSEVFLTFGFVQTLDMDAGSGAVVAIGAGMWFGATVVVLLMMESLSAFLHSLRLHWVEYQNKFYAADGIPFHPLDIS